MTGIIIRNECLLAKASKVRGRHGMHVAQSPSTIYLFAARKFIVASGLATKSITKSENLKIKILIIKNRSSIGELACRHTHWQTIRQ